MQGRITAQEIIRQSNQGVSVKPFLIRADDDQTYFVKGFARAGGPGLISEVLAAELASHLNLPVPAWRIMDVPQALIDFSAVANVHDLGGGPAFASLQVENAADLMWSKVNDIPVELRKAVLLFDWWIQNGDRNLGENGLGNVNLLLDPKGELAVIDHNAAFDLTLTHEEFRQYHVFRDLLGADRDNLLARLNYEPQLDAALNDWSRIVTLLPEEWIYRDADQIDETEPTLQQRLHILERYRDERFWGQL